MAIFIGILMIGVGFLLVWKTEWFLSSFGRIGWAEQHLGTEGGSRLFYKLLGVILMLAGFSAITGLHQAILKSLILPLFGIRSKNPFQ